MKTSPALKKIRIFWGRHVAVWRRSGLTQVAYAREHSLALKSFSYWVRRNRVTPKTLIPLSGNPVADNIPDNIPGLAKLEPVKFVPVSGELMKQTVGKNFSPAPLSLFVGRQFRVDIPSDFHPETLARVIRVLEVF